ncbi:MAG: PQQ-dependent sugar dehydrogenase [Actinomycetes bacterium]
MVTHERPGLSRTVATIIATGGVIGAMLGTSPGVAAANTSGVTVTPAQSLAKGLVDRLVGDVPAPTDIAFTPNGRGLITSRAGTLRIIRDDAVLAHPAVDLSGRICSNGERGLLGIAVDPKFRTTHWIYLFWTFDKSDSCGEAPAATPVNRVTRFTLDGTTVARGSAQLIVDNIPSPASNHNAGDLAFGADNRLYITTGDGGCEIGVPTDCGELNDNSRRLDIPNGKVLRVTRGGGIPADNPYVGALGARLCAAPGGPDVCNGPCLETFASGLRNPFRMDIAPGTSTPWVNDVGQSTWEEIDQIQAGADYGWNIREGFCATGSTTDCTATAYADPQFSYDRSTGCRTVTGAAFVPTGTWSGRFDGDYIFADFACNSIWRLHDGGGLLSAKPLSPADGPVALAFGPSPRGRALYYLENVTGEIHRLNPR